jgi:hypothetical protein
LTVTNEYGDIRILALVATKSHAEFESALIKMRESLSMFGHSQPKLFYTDNPTADKHFLESIFPSLTKNVIPVAKYPSLQSYVLPSGVGYSTSSTATAINGACARILDDLDPSNEFEFIKLALDAEFNVNMTRGGGPEPTSTVQIAYKNWVDIFQVILRCDFYMYLYSLLSSPDWPLQGRFACNSTVASCKPSDSQGGP